MYEDLLEVAREAARAGSDVVERYFGDERLEYRAKGANDFVTRADRESEEAIVEVIRRQYPDHRIVAEEGGEVGAGDGDGNGDSRRVWLVDPLDGTTNFMHGLPIYAVSIACVEGDRTVAAVVAEPHAENEFMAVAGGGAFCNERPIEVSGRPRLAGGFIATGYPFRARATIDTYLAVFRSVFLKAKALRRTGAAALDLAYTAAGVFDGFFEFRLAPWDIAAGALLIEEAGGLVTDLDGGRRERQTGNVVAGSPAVHRQLLAAVGEHTSEDHLETLAPLASLD